MKTHTMQLIAGLIALLISTTNLRADLVPNPSAVTQLSLTGSDFQGQDLDATAYTGLQMLFCGGTNITGLALPATSEILFYLRANQNALASMPDLTGFTALIRITFEDCNLSEEQIDELLHQLVKAHAENGNLGILGNAAPSATGLDYVTELESRGWTIEHE